MQERSGGIVLPIPTDALTKLIERDAADLDLYADLSSAGSAGSDVEGVTTFIRGEKPRVHIAAELSEQERLVHRLRTTLTHEYGHVWLHNPLWQPRVHTLPLLPDL